MSNEENALRQRSFGSAMSKMGNLLSLIIALIILSVVLSFLSPYFMSFENWMNILLASAITLIRASGATIAMITGGMDLSQNSVGAFAGVVCITLSVQAGVPLPVLILLSIAIGAGFGAINSTLIAVCKINPVITTIGTMQIFRGFAWIYTDKTVQSTDPDVIFMGRGRIADAVPVSVIIAVGVMLLAWFILKYTRYGRKIYMVGGNENASKLSGINSDKVKFIAYLICGICSGFAGFLVAGQVGAALPQSGNGQEMTTISAIVLGGLSLQGGKGSMWGTLLGVIILQVVANGLTLMSVNEYVQMVVTGSILILAVLIDVIRSGALKKQ